MTDASTTPGPGAYDLPNARRVVGAGLQLAIASAADLRRASIYVGLLVLGALGPALVYAIAAIRRLEIDLGALSEGLAAGDTAYLEANPELVGPLLLVELLAVVGIALLAAISIDAQAIGVALLGGRAAGASLRLSEAIGRARQVFWRLAGASLLIAVYSNVVQLLVGSLLGGARVDTNPALQFIVAVIATVATAPFAYVAAGIVLGDVGVLEVLRRSTILFRARPLVAVVVVLFTLVTTAIELFALGAGLELVVLAGETLGADVSAGVAGLILATMLALGAVTAFGSLLFTVAALLSAPQVAAFLGLTFYAAGLDRARAGAGQGPGARWVSLPMQVGLVILTGSALLGIVSLR